MESLEFLEKLINTHSPSGFEKEASELWSNYVRQFTDDIKECSYGNVFATLNPEGKKKIMLCSHIDEVGMMVNYINDDGFIYFSSIGGVDASILPAMEVVIRGKEKDVIGVVGSKPIHLSSEDDAEIKMHNLYIDIGATSREEVLKKVSVGDPIVVNRSFRFLLNNRIIGRGLDDRVGAWCVSQILKNLSNKRLDHQVCGVLTIQEENGLYGATMSSYRLKPDAAIAIDVTHAIDAPGLLKERYGEVILGGGPVLSVGSSIHRGITKSLIDVAEKSRIDIQKTITPCYTGTDADGIFTTAGGIPTTIISIPNRYMHTPVEMVQLEDLYSIIDLVVAWCQEVEDF